SARFAEPGTAAQEIERRLSKHVSTAQGLLVVRDGYGSVYTLPPWTPWRVTCDFSGLHVSFGYMTGNDSGSVDVLITETSFAETQCETLGPAVGVKLLELSAGAPPQGEFSKPLDRGIVAPPSVR